MVRSLVHECEAIALDLGGKMHPCTIRDIFGWSNTTAASILGISEQTIKSYSYRPDAAARREPSDRTMRQTWDKCQTLLISGHQPINSALVPVKLQQYLIPSLC